MVKQTKTDVVSGSLTYYGEAVLGAATTDKKWMLRRTSVSGTVTTVDYPIGPLSFPTDSPEFIWDDRAIYNYGLTQDLTAPTLTTVTIAGDGTDPAYVKTGDTVTITIVSSEYLNAISATIAGHDATVTEGIDNKHYTATYVMVAGDTEGVVPFTIDFEDITGRDGTQVTAVTSGDSVTFDKTVPTAAITYDTALAVKSGATLVITATFSEAMLDSPIPKIAISGSNTLAATNMTKSSTTVYTYSHTVGAGDGTATVALSVGTDVASNVITAAPTSGATFTVDNTLPTLDSSVRDTNTQITVTLSELATTASITKANDGGFVVTETGGVATYAVSGIAPGATNDKVVLTVADMAVSANDGVTITYTAGGNGTVADPAGNALATDGTGVTIAAWDEVAPTMSSAVRDSDTQITITMDEDMDSTSVTNANDGGFVVAETGTPATTYAVSAVAAGGSPNLVVLTVADISASITPGVTVTYATGGNGTATDVAGNVLATDATGVVIPTWA